MKNQNKQNKTATTPQQLNQTASDKILSPPPPPSSLLTYRVDQFYPIAHLCSYYFFQTARKSASSLHEDSTLRIQSSSSLMHAADVDLKYFILQKNLSSTMLQ
jgi:hypothetical protein